jgi:thiamine pyrophosphate-dependent acetolactate synthase large subunit-like protein/nitrite reductase/ring-hydroxylating ferredoxin subunit
MEARNTTVVWTRVAHVDDLPEGRVSTVSVNRGHSVIQICLTHIAGTFSALDNHCPHQGGPLGEGSIECDNAGSCFLRCPWHGWDFDPVTGKPPGGYDDGVATYPVEVRDGEVFVGLEPEPKHERTVTDVMAETMVAWGVTSVFGMVGHSNLGLADAIRRRTEAGELDYIGIRHEGAAAFAASAFGKLTGRPAACLTIAGPGATNLLTGCWDAKVDRAPLLALTGQVNQQVFGPGAFQELPLKEAFSAVAAYSHLCLPGSNHAELMGNAVKTAINERQVAHIIFPDDTQALPAGDGAEAGSPDGRFGDPRIRPSTESLGRAVEMLAQARRPVIVAGHGARFEMDAVTALADELSCPVLTTFKGKGIIGDHPDPAMPHRPGHPLGCGVLGRSGTPIASWFMNECDLMLVVGASFSNHTGITPKKPTIQVDSDRSQLARFQAIDCPLWGEIGETARELLTAVAGRHHSHDVRGEIAERWRIWREEKSSRLEDRSDRGVSSIAVFNAMNRVVPENAIIAVDVGNNTYSFGRYFEASGRQAVLMSGYLGSIGFGYPAAMGAWAATRAHLVSREAFWRRFAGRPVVCVTGDGGFGQYAWEVNTAVRHGMNLTHVLLNNNELGKISKEQRAGHWSVWQTGLTNPNIADYVSSCGGFGIRVEQVSKLAAALEQALAYDGAATVEIMTDVDLL